MTINFDYHGSAGHLGTDERSELVKDLAACLPRYDYFSVDENSVDVCGDYDDEDGYVDVARDIETVLLKYDIAWQGEAEPEDSEPDWDRMPGGVDFC